MTELIGTISLYKHTLWGFTKRNNSYNDWARPLTVVLQVSWAYECICDIWRKFYNKLLKILKKQNVTDRQMEGQKMRNIVSPQIQFSVLISHAYHIQCWWEYIILDYHYTILWILHFHTQNSIIPNISPVIECSISYFV